MRLGEVRKEYFILIDLVAFCLLRKCTLLFCVPPSKKKDCVYL